jgi:hypothetical protein
MMAGHRRMNLSRFVPLLAAGIVLKLIVIWICAKQVEDELESILDFIGKYQWWLVGGLFALSFLQSGRKMRKGTISTGPADDPLD